MVLNVIWIGFFLVAFVVAAIKLVFLGDTAVFSAMVDSTFEMAATGFEISLGLTGVLVLWLGLNGADFALFGRARGRPQSSRIRRT